MISCGQSRRLQSCRISIRTQSGGFTLAQSYTPETLTQLYEDGRLMEVLTKTEEVFSSYKKVFLTAAEARRVKNGVPLRRDNLNYGQFYRLYDENGGFLCVSKQEDGVLRMQTSFWTA